MDAERWSNVCRARWAYEHGEERIGAYPQEAILEISARCNLRCQMCAINYDTRHRSTSGRPAYFEPALFERLRPLFPDLLRAHLYGLGEPVLNRHLVSFIEELSRAGVETCFTTNATLIDEERAFAFARAGADRISVSIDGATAKTYETIRRGAKFSSLLRGVAALGEARRRYGRPCVTVNFVAMASNFRELPLMVEMCAEHGVSELSVEPLFYWGEESPELKEHYGRESLARFPREEGRQVLAEAQRRAKQHGLYFCSRLLASEGSLDYRARVAEARDGVSWVCSEPWSTVFITAAGEVRTCCLNGTVFGNLFEQSFDEIWNGEPYRIFRRQHFGADVIPTGCATCKANGRQRHNPLFAAVEPVSYRPLLALAGEAPRPQGLALDWPRDGVAVTDPLVLTGSVADRGMRRFFGLGRRAWPHLMIDRTPIGLAEDSVVDGDRFVALLSAPYLSEGAHVLSLRSDVEPAPGWGRRTVHVVRSPARGQSLPATATATVICPLSRATRDIEVRLNGRAWTGASWLCGRTRRGGRGPQCSTWPSCRPAPTGSRSCRAASRPREFACNAWDSEAARGTHIRTGDSNHERIATGHPALHRQHLHVGLAQRRARERLPHPAETGEREPHGQHEGPDGACHDRSGRGAFGREKLDHMKILGARLQIVPSESGRMTEKLTRDMIEAAGGISMLRNSQHSPSGKRRRRTARADPPRCPRSRRCRSSWPRPGGRLAPLAPLGHRLRL